MTETPRINFRLIISSLLQLAGIAGIVWGCVLVAPVLGIIVGSVFTLWVARVIDPPADPILRSVLFAFFNGRQGKS